jgi:hypothetical protein
MKITVELNALHPDFYWANKGYPDEYGEPIRCSSEDIIYTVHGLPQEYIRKFSTIESKNWIRVQFDFLKTKQAHELEAISPGFIAGTLRGDGYQKTMPELMESEEIIFRFCYHEPNGPSYDDPNCPELNLPNLPINEYGKKPWCIDGLAPDEFLSKKVVEKVMDTILRKCYEVGEECDIVFIWVDELSDKDLDDFWHSAYKDNRS